MAVLFNFIKNSKALILNLSKVNLKYQNFLTFRTWLCSSSKKFEKDFIFTDDGHSQVQNL